MKVALLSAIVFGAISAAASSSHVLADEYYLQNFAHAHYPSYSSAKKSTKKSKDFKSEYQHSEYQSEHHSKHHISKTAPLLLKRVNAGNTLEIGEGAANVIKSALEGGKKSGDTIINHYGTSTSESLGGHFHPGSGGNPQAYSPYAHPPYAHPPYAHPYPPPQAAGGTDALLHAKVDKIGRKFTKLKGAQIENTKQIQIIQEMQARTMMEEQAGGARGATAAKGDPEAQQKKRSFGKGSMFLTAAGGLTAGVIGTKMLDSKPAVPDTAYSPQDMAAIQQASAGTPGGATIDGPTAQGGQGQGESQGGGGGGSGGGQPEFLGPYFDQATQTRYIIDGEGYYHFLGSGNHEIRPPPGWSKNGPVRDDGSGGAETDDGSNGQQEAAGGAAGGGAAGGGAAGGGAAGGGVARGADSGPAAGFPQTSANGADVAPQRDRQFPSSAEGGQSDSSNKPIWDNTIKMYYVVGPNGVKFYIDTETGYLVNSVTLDISDPKTGQIIMSGKDVMKGSSTGPGGAAGGNAGGNAGRMKKRSIRHHQFHKRSYEQAALYAQSPALRAQARIAMLRDSGRLQPTVSAAARKAGIGKTLVKVGLGAGLLIGTVLAVGAYAHPNRPGTSPDNEYGLVPTSICDVYGEPIVQDFRKVLWNKSTLTRLDPNNLPPLHTCSKQELEDAGVSTEQQGAMQKRDSVESKSQDQMAKLVQDAKADHSEHNLRKRSETNTKERDHSLEKRQGEGAVASTVAKGAGLAFLPSIGWAGAAAIGATALVTAIYLHNIHKEKELAAMQEWNSQYHSAGEAASSVGNAISTGANGQLFNPLTGSLIMVDPNTGLYYDASTGEQVNPKTGMPSRYGGEDSSQQQQQQQAPQLPLDNAGNMSGNSPEVQKAMEQWNLMSPQQQQQLLNQYGSAAQQILDSPDPNAALQAWSQQQAQQAQAVQPVVTQRGPVIPQSQQQQQQLPPSRYNMAVSNTASSYDGAGGGAGAGPAM
ncbi:hypothetical protein NDA11_007198 [Ustilago hordei]|nr:hypothetical protein NDA11_007198 [Ustilago hordei]